VGVKTGKLCIEVAPESKIAFISEVLCIGCGICVKVCQHTWFSLSLVSDSKQKCPYEAITIINLPKSLEKDTAHRYGPNAFKLHRCVLLRFETRVLEWTPMWCLCCLSLMM
jgi:ATP-binding cassette subfamily E protein 1